MVIVVIIHKQYTDQRLIPRYSIDGQQWAQDNGRMRLA